MDPLSEILSLLKPRGYMFGGLDVGAPWAVRYHASGGIKCQAIGSGHGWLTVDGIAEPIALEAGDCVLLPSSRAFCLATELGLEPIDFLESIGAPLEGARPRADVSQTETRETR